MSKTDQQTQPQAQTQAPSQTQPQAQAQPQPQPQAKSDTVVVGLCLPRGISFKLPGKILTLNGNGSSLVGKDKGTLPVGGFGLTSVAKEDWEYIKKKFSSLAVFKSGLIFSTDTMSSAENEAKNREKVRSGYEPVEAVEPK
jgi:hypothetical protein